MTPTEELDNLRRLHDGGTITDEQYERARAKLLAEVAGPEAGEAPQGRERRPRRLRDPDPDDAPYADRSKTAREWGMLLHLSLFFGHLIPLGGIVSPVVIWQTKKAEIPELDEHGKNAVNWVLSFLLYAALSAVLCFAFIGFVLLPIVLAMNVVFPIVAAVRANEGRAWRYPLAIRFLT
jgi:uncharacterized Tic20 family protein